MLQEGGTAARDTMNLRDMREVETALCGMIFDMRRAVTTRDDGAYVYAGRTTFALLTRPMRGPRRASLGG